MSITASKRSSSSKIRLLILTAAAIAVWVGLPFILQNATSHADSTPTTSTLVANLSGSPIASVTPTGIGVYTTAMLGTNTATRSLRVEVSTVNLPAGTSLTVFHKTTSIGTIMLDAMHHGILLLTTNNGGVVPMVVSGDALSVKNGTAVVLSGAFTAPPTPTPTATPTGTPTGTPTPHTPTPTPTGTPTPATRLFAPLSGGSIGGIVPRGLGEYTSQGTMRLLEVYVSYVNLPENTVLAVSVGETAIGNITLHNHGGCLRLGNTAGTANVPVITAGTTLTIKNGTATVLAGTFSATPPTPTPTPTPSGSPSPTPSHTPTPTPSPNGTPAPATAFSANLRGANEVPAVTSDGRGCAFIRINSAGTEISVRVAYVHLGTAATTITINGPAAIDANGPVIFTIANTGGTSGMTAPQTFAVTAAQIAQLRNGVWYVNISTTGNTTGEIRGQIRSVNRRADFTGDGLSDIAVMRTVNGAAPDNASNEWYILNSDDSTVSLQRMGQVGDINVQGDYDGDGIADIAMFTPSTGMWQIRRSETGEVSNTRFGIGGDVPVVGDYDGDSINDIAVFRPSNGTWYISRSSDGSVTTTRWGLSGDRPVTGDFDGDGNNDLAVFRPSDGNWYVNRSSDGGLLAMHWGANGDQPVAGDFDGDGTADIAVFRPSDGNWYIYRSWDGDARVYHFGLAGDIPTACEFDGDGITDIAVFRPADGNWYIMRSADNSFGAYHFGLPTDRPLPAIYTP